MFPNLISCCFKLVLYDASLVVYAFPDQLGTLDVGEFIVPIPYVKQIKVKIHPIFYVNDLFPFVFSLYDVSVYLGPPFGLYILYVMHEVSNA